MSHNHLKTPRERENQLIAQRLHQEIKKTSPGFKLSHVYHMLSKACGFRDWNTAKACGVDFTGAVEKLKESGGKYEV